MMDKILHKLLVSREDAKSKIEVQIEKGEKLRDREINSKKELKQAIKDCENWEKCNKDVLLKLFGPSPIEKNYNAFSHYTVINLDTSIPSRTKEAMTQSLINLEAYRVWVGCYIDHLTIIQIRLGTYDKPSDPVPRTFGNKVFIVHGHNEGAKHKITRFVERLDLTAIILDEQPSKGQTIIDKFKEYADEAGFAVVLLTSDDAGASKDKIDVPKPRARQNVILELGYFLSALVVPQC